MRRVAVPAVDEGVDLLLETGSGYATRAHSSREQASNKPDAASQKDADPRRHEADTLSAAPYDRFSKEFAGARLPACLHSDGLKYQPTFFLSGIIALPFVAVAKLHGICR
jgi:hypothetical protein